MRDLIDAVAVRLGLGPVEGATQRYAGRNANVSATTRSGRRIFVKRVYGANSTRFARALDFERHAGPSPARPALLGHDEEHQILVYDFIPDATSLGAVAQREELTVDLACSVGEEVADLHSTDIGAVETAPHLLPSMRYFGEIPLDVFLGMTAGELELVRLLQADPELAAAVLAIITSEDEGAYDRAYIHADLRLDQILVADGTLLLGDFEDARAGDPARDLGSLIGDLLYLALLTIPRRAADLATGGSAGHAEIMTAGSAALDDVTPVIHAFVDGYTSRRGPLGEDLEARALRFAGWHMFDRLFATAESAFRLDGAAKAAAGIGRSLLIHPEVFVDLVRAKHPVVAA